MSLAALSYTQNTMCPFTPFPAEKNGRLRLLGPTASTPLLTAPALSSSL